MMPSIKESLRPGAADTDGSVCAEFLEGIWGGNTSETIKLAERGK